MSKENLIKLLESAAEDEQLMQQLQGASSYEAVKSLARQQGFDLGELSAEEAQRTVDVVTGAVTDELSDEELETVAGGFVYGKVTWTWRNDPKGSGNSSQYTATDDLWE